MVFTKEKKRSCIKQKFHLREKKRDTLKRCSLPSRFPHRQRREVTITQRWHHHTLYKVTAAAAAAATKVVETEAGRGAARVKSQEWVREWRHAYHRGTIQSAAGVFAVVKKRLQKKLTKSNDNLRTGYCVPASCKHRVWTWCRKLQSVMGFDSLCSWKKKKEKKRCTLLVKLANKSQPTLLLAGASLVLVSDPLVTSQKADYQKCDSQGNNTAQLVEQDTKLWWKGWQFKFTAPTARRFWGVLGQDTDWTLNPGSILHGSSHPLAWAHLLPACREANRRKCWNLQRYVAG